MKKIISILLISIIVFSCKKQVSLNILDDLTKDEISGERLWHRITIEENYKKEYSNWPKHKGLESGETPHGRFIRTYINPKLKFALPIKEKIAPVGSIIIKENYTPDKELAAVTVMAKVKDYDPEHNDWYWAKYSNDGKPPAAGKINGCIDCHTATDNDFIFLWNLDQPLE